MASGILKNNSVIWTNEQYDLNRLLSPCECILTFFFWVALWFKQLKDTKSNDQTTTLLHFLAQMCEEEFPDAIKFVEDLQHVDRASRGKRHANSRLTHLHFSILQFLQPFEKSKYTALYIESTTDLLAIHDCPWAWFE